uniref:CCHC-type domain-containing protein n=1 Tax=Nelumbo nucifera TaxID=4432 RepID=A0A822XRK7_NELNU|nr:TPA_asm: hypothetical protein HUJ06_024115 [Nelumbo nucifera]
MSSFTSAVELSPLLDPASPYYIHHSDHHGLVTVSLELTSSNYASWSRSFLLALSIRNKTGFVDGTIKEPALDGALHSAWKRCNNLIVAWLLRSISPPIASIVFYINSASRIWEVLKKRFPQPDDSKICNLQTVDAYFTELTGIWEELRSYRPLPHCQCGKCNKDCFEIFSEAQQKEYVFKFINGLNESFSALRSQVMIMKPFPNLDEKKKSSVICSHCGKKGHSKDKCYRITGFPPNFKFTKGKSATGGTHSANNVTQGTGILSNVSETSPALSLTPEHTRKLLTLLNGCDSHSSPISQPEPPTNTAFAGILDHTHSINSHCSSSQLSPTDIWIVDTGATYHIANSLKYFDSYTTIPGLFVNFPNRTKVQATHIGTIPLASAIILNDVLFVPSFSFNLISVQKFAKDSNSSIIFTADSCVL